MEFNTPAYFLFLAIVLMVYYLLRGYRAQRLLIVVASLLFYAFWSPSFLLHFVGIVMLNYAASLFMLRARTLAARRWILGATIAIDLVNLATFKYAALIAGSLDAMLGQWLGGAMFDVPDLILPLAISFYTFHVISYLVDVYHERPGAQAESLWDFLFYVTLFPHQIAGPILRGHELFYQMRHQALLWDNIRQGFERLLLGLFQKAVIADNLAIVADHGFADPQALSSGEMYVVLLAYTFQIFFDFAGYSNMAIGSARMLGYILPENFNNPYIAGSISDFWRRWHMTLSRWIRDYIFIPLGGSHGTARRTAVNLLITMGLAGIWHGAAWTFLVWGLYHGAGLAMYRVYAASAFRTWITHLVPARMYSILMVVLTFHFVLLGWVLFRAADFTVAAFIYARLWDGLGDAAAWTVAPIYLFKGYGFTAMLVYGLYLLLRRLQVTGYWMQDRLRRAYAYVLVMYLVLYLAPLHTEPFIYFQF